MPSLSAASTVPGVLAGLLATVGAPDLDRLAVQDCAMAPGKGLKARTCRASCDGRRRQSSGASALSILAA